MYFSQTFISVMIIGALVFIAAASAILIILLIKDIRNKKLW